MPQLKTRLLIADDEPKYVRSLTFILESKGYEVITAADGQRAIEAAAREVPALILLDVRIPVVDGYEICRRIRDFSLAPILMLTALGQDTNVMTGLRAGADDYLVKPFDIEVLLARLETFRRWSAADSALSEMEFQFGDLQVDCARQQVWLAGQPARRGVPLTVSEYRVLYELARAAGRSVPQEVLLQKVWGADRTEASKFIPVFIGRLRQKIEADPAAPQYILSQPGQCYSLGQRG